MSRFDDTVEKLASAPWKRALFPHLPGLVKEAGLPPRFAANPKQLEAAKKLDFSRFAPKKPATFPPNKLDLSKLLPGGQKQAGWFSSLAGEGAGQEIAKDTLKAVAGAAALGGTGYVGARLMSGTDDASEKNKARFTTMGKLEAEQRFRQHQLRRMNPVHDAMLSQLGEDPILQKADPALLQSSYETMRRFAPTLATDPNATRAFLQEAAVYGKGPSYATLKTLADTEGSVMKTYGGGE